MRPKTLFRLFMAAFIALFIMFGAAIFFGEALFSMPPLAPYAGLTALLPLVPFSGMMALIAAFNLLIPVPLRAAMMIENYNPSGPLAPKLVYAPLEGERELFPKMTCYYEQLVWNGASSPNVTSVIVTDHRIILGDPMTSGRRIRSTGSTFWRAGTGRPKLGNGPNDLVVDHVRNQEFAISTVEIGRTEGMTPFLAISLNFTPPITVRLYHPEAERIFAVFSSPLS